MILKENLLVVNSFSSLEIIGIMLKSGPKPEVRCLAEMREPENRIRTTVAEAFKVLESLKE